MTRLILPAAGMSACPAVICRSNLFASSAGETYAEMNGIGTQRRLQLIPLGADASRNGLAGALQAILPSSRRDGSWCWLGDVPSERLLQGTPPGHRRRGPCRRVRATLYVAASGQRALAGPGQRLRQDRGFA